MHLLVLTVIESKVRCSLVCWQKAIVAHTIVHLPGVIELLAKHHVPFGIDLLLVVQLHLQGDVLLSQSLQFSHFLLFLIFILAC